MTTLSAAIATRNCVPASARSVLLLAALVLAGCAAVEPGALTDRDGWVIQREFLQHGGKRIELFWTKPAAGTRLPAVLFIHGHQEVRRDGGELYVRTGRLGIMARQGYVAASLSQPGYGNSDGPPDFCGPVTQDAALAAIEYLRAKPFVDANKVVLYGYSRGAIVAAMVATRDAKLAAVVLGAGAYDFFSWYPTPLPGIDTNIRREAGTSAAAFRARSALYHADKISAAVLLLHGERDERISVRQAQAFAAELGARGVRMRLKVFPNATHSIPVDEQFRDVYPFLERIRDGVE
jgi:dipeptidyl aminopeptidase/acylaminoacyl peptidase